MITTISRPCTKARSILDQSCVVARFSLLIATSDTRRQQAHTALKYFIHISKIFSNHFLKVFKIYFGPEFRIFNILFSNIFKTFSSNSIKSLKKLSLLVRGNSRGGGIVVLPPLMDGDNWKSVRNSHVQN